MNKSTRPVVQRAAELRVADVEWDSVMRQLRDEGFSKIDCMLAIAVLENRTVGEAKGMVHFSPAWEDRREQDDQFPDALIDAVEKVGWDNCDADKNH